MWVDRADVSADPEAEGRGGALSLRLILWCVEKTIVLAKEDRPGYIGESLEYK